MLFWLYEGKFSAVRKNQFEVKINVQSVPTPSSVAPRFVGHLKDRIHLSIDDDLEMEEMGAKWWHWTRFMDHFNRNAWWRLTIMDFRKIIWTVFWNSLFCCRGHHFDQSCEWHWNPRINRWRFFDTSGFMKKVGKDCVQCKGTEWQMVRRMIVFALGSPKFVHLRMPDRGFYNQFHSTLFVWICLCLG